MILKAILAIKDVVLGITTSVLLFLNPSPVQETQIVVHEPLVPVQEQTAEQMAQDGSTTSVKLTIFAPPANSESSTTLSTLLTSTTSTAITTNVIINTSLSTQSAPIVTTATQTHVYIPVEIIVPVQQPQPSPQPIQQTQPQIQQQQIMQLEIIVKGQNRATYVANDYKLNPDMSLQAGSVTPSTDNYVDLGVIVRDDNGNVLRDVTVEVTSTDQSQNKSLVGSGDLTSIYPNGEKKFVHYYPYRYEFRTIGDHTITFTTGGVSQSKIFNAIEPVHP